MSVEGFHEYTKHGGAHETTHEITKLSNESQTAQYEEEQMRNAGCQSFDAHQEKQNGDKREVDSDCSCLPDHLQFLAEELDSYDQTIAENNSEWLKSRCKNADSVCFDCPSQNISTNVLSSTETVNNIQIVDCAQTGVLSLDPETEIPLDTDSVAFSNVQSILIAENDTVSTHIQIPSTDPVISVANVQNDMLTSLNNCSPSAVLPLLTSPAAIMGYEAGNKTELPPFVLQNIVYAKENQVGIMAPLELESMPSLSFDDTVRTSVTSGPNMKICENDSFITIVPTASDGKLLDTTMLNKLQTEQSNSYVTATSMTSVINTGLLNTGSQVTACGTTLMNTRSEHSETRSTNASLPSGASDQLLQQGNLNLSTISISNDKASNSTKILVDTSEGQQLYEINLSDFTRRTQCINTQAGVVLPQIAVANSASLSGPTEQPAGDTYITHAKETVPGLVLLPVSEQNGAPTTGMLMSMPAEQAETLTDSKFFKVKGKKMYICTEPECGKMFQKVSELNVHHMSHSGLRPFKCAAEGCDWAFTTIYKLRRHEESHQGNKKFVCEVCQKKYTTIYNLQSHVKLHDRPCNETCPADDCGLKFSTKRQLAFHVRSAHEGTEKMYKCPVEGCEKLFYSEHCMGSHPRVHLQDPNELVCQFEGCGRKFEKLCRLKQHQRMHTGEKPFVCHHEGCDWAFTTASKLTRHVVKHTGKRKWICKTCSRAFMRAEHLKGHMITHSGLRPFHCPVQDCDCKFAAKSSLYVHIKKHNHTMDDVTYHCPMENCNRKYLSKANLRSHIMKHFPGCLTPEDAAQLNIVPLMEKGDTEAGNQKLTDTIIPLPPNHAITVKTAADGTVTLNPADFIAPGEGKIEAHYTAELTAPLSSKMATYLTDNTHVGPIQHMVIMKKGESSDSSTGSARTDFRSNKLLSDRARKRQKLLREKTDSAELHVAPAEASNSQNVVVTETSQLSETCISPQGITFRDPHTGVLYVQMQLLQDDPPHPDVYMEEGILNGELTLPDSPDSEMVDHTQVPTEFVGSTINLQDLVG